MGRYFLILITAYIVPALFMGMSAKSVCNIAVPVTGGEVAVKEVTVLPCTKTISQEKAEKKDYQLFTDHIFLHI
jgi:short subunit fatty acids transporter